MRLEVNQHSSRAQSKAATSAFLPNVFILGAMKCGTSTLHAYLDDLPDVCMSHPKEPYFFEAEYEKGLDHYRQAYFAHWNGEPVVGGARHRNLYLPYVPARIHETNPDARLIVVLRNPTLRAFSHWYFYRWHKVEDLPLRAALEADLERIQQGHCYQTPEEIAEHVACFQRNGGSGDGPYRTYLDTGYYFQQIQRYLELFPAEQLRVVLFEDLTRDPRGTINSLVEFLELDPDRNRFTEAKRENGSQPPDPPGWVSKVWHGSGLRAVLPGGLRDRVYHFAYSRIRKALKPSLDTRTRRWLIDHYREHNRQLADWLGRDLSHWDQ